MVKKLNLPIIKVDSPTAKCLSMDDYLKFVNLHLKYTLDKKVARRYKKLIGVNIAFLLK